MRPCGTKFPLQFGQPVHARKAYGNDLSIDTFIYLQRLSLAAIYDALSYYYDNREDVDAEIKANDELSSQAEAQ